MATMLKILFLLLLLVLVILARQALLPLLIGITIAYMLDPYVCWLQKKLRAGRGISILVAYLSVIISVFLLIWGFARLVTGEFASGTLAESVSILKTYYEEYGSAVEEVFHFSFGSADIGRWIKKLSRLAAGLLIGMIMAVYLLKDKDFFLCLASKFLHLFLPQKPHGILREILFDMDIVLSSFLRGVFVDSVIVAFLSALVLTVLNIDFALFIGFFAGVANVIPYFGPILSMIPAALAGMAAGGLPKAAAAAVALFIVQQIECNFIYPRIVGKSTGLHPLFVLAAVSIAGFFGGLLWMVLAVPIAGAVNVLVSKWAENQ